MNTISFIVPVYNVEKYIRQCLESIVSQIDKLPGSEIIVVNDGTKDNSMDIVTEFQKLHDYIKVINQENGGLSKARNTGLANATCDYVWFVDSDDWLLSNALLDVFDAFKSHPECDFYAAGLSWSLNGEVIKVDITGGPYVYETGVDFLKAKHSKGAAPRYIIKRTYLLNNGILFLEGVVHEDAHFGHIMPMFAKGVYVFDKPLYSYRQREEGSIMHSITMRSAYDSIKMHKDLMRFADNRLEGELRSWFIFNCRDILMGFYQYIQPLFFTKEYNIFYKQNKQYIKEQIQKCISLSDKGGLSKRRLQLFSMSPRFSIYVTKIVGLIIRYLRNIKG